MTEQEKYADEIVTAILENNVTLYSIDDDIDCMDDEKAKEELLNLLGENKYVESKSKKEHRNCVISTIYYFPKHNLHLKEIQTGPCHYKDVAIDGLPDQIEYFICEEIQTVSYKVVKQV